MTYQESDKTINDKETKASDVENEALTETVDFIFKSIQSKLHRDIKDVGSIKSALTEIPSYQLELINALSGGNASAFAEKWLISKPTVNTDFLGALIYFLNKDTYHASPQVQGRFFAALDLKRALNELQEIHANRHERVRLSINFDENLKVLLDKNLVSFDAATKLKSYFDRKVLSLRFNKIELKKEDAVYYWKAFSPLLESEEIDLNAIKAFVSIAEVLIPQNLKTVEPWDVYSVLLTLRNSFHYKFGDILLDSSNESVES